MTTKDFQALWKKIEGKPVNIHYGKQTFRNVKLVGYKPLLGIVKTEMRGELNTRAIKSIEIIEQPKEVVEVEAQEVIVTPRLPDGWKDNGYFAIVGKFGGNWKSLELRDKMGNVHLRSVPSMKHQELFEAAKELITKKKVKANVIVDDTYCAPQYYFINKHLSIDKIV